MRKTWAKNFQNQTNNPALNNMDRPSFAKMLESYRTKIVTNSNREEIKGALAYCCAFKQPLPDWLSNELLKLIDDFFGVGKPGPVVSGLQRSYRTEIDRLRYAAVVMARKHGISWTDAYGFAADIFSDTGAAGSEEAIKKSYQKIRRQERGNH